MDAPTDTDRLMEARAWAEQLRDDLTAYAKDRNPEQRSISPGLMLVRLKPLLDLLTTEEAARLESESDDE